MERQRGGWMSEVWGGRAEESFQPEPENPLDTGFGVNRPGGGTAAAPDGKKQGQGDVPDDGVNIEVLRQKILVPKLPVVSFDDVKGQDSAVEMMRELDEQLRNREEYEAWGAEIPQGVLLHGPSGTGKTMMVQALANSAQFAFLSVDCADINSKFFGNPERYAEAVFQIANEEAARHPSGHCILFMDEVEALLRARGEGGHEASEKVVSIFLQQMDGLTGGSNVTVVAATNLVSSLDKAFISRMDVIQEVPLPDKFGRAAILEARMQKLQKKAGRDILGDIDWQALGVRLLRHSGRDIKMLTNRVVRAKGKESVAAKTAGAERPGPIDTDYIVQQAVKSSKVRSLLGPEAMALLKQEFGLDRPAAAGEAAAESDTAASTAEQDPARKRKSSSKKKPAKE